MENLKRFLKALDASSSKDQIVSTFQTIADILLRKCYIIKGNRKFRMIEIEFYFYNTHHKDNITYKRTESAGRWFVHHGVDITLNSNEKDGFYGGILIRSIVDVENGDATFGPEKCLWELFDEEALEPNTLYPFIELNEDGNIKGNIKTTQRYKVNGNYKDALYRYYVDDIDLKGLSKYTANPWKK